MGIEAGAKKVGFIKLDQPYKRPEKKVTLRQMHDKAILAIAKNKIDMNDFTNLYGEGVEKDMLKAEALKQKFEADQDEDGRECKDCAEVMEAVLVESINDAEWLGTEMRAVNTSDYDDFENGIDIVTEITKQDGSKKQLGLAMDATFANRIDDKFRGIKGEIEKNKLGELKYFKSGNFKGSLSQVPHVVVGVSKRKIEELGRLWVKGDVEGIKNHQLQYQILDGMIIQLETFEKYAIQVGKPELAEVYRHNCETLKAIKFEKEKVLPDNGERDHIFENIKREMDKFLDK